MAAVLATSGCASHGVVHDGTSVSYGPSNAGVLLNPAELPVQGEGYVVPERWAQRGLRYGTDEAVALIVQVAREVTTAKPGSLLGVGDLSPRRGGPSAWHRSHQTGRDVDLIYFAVDAQGNPVAPTEMVPYSTEGVAVVGDGVTLSFDVERNWLLVKALVTSQVADVQWIFVADWLRQQMLDYAVAKGEPEHIVLAASYLMGQPGDSLPHDDHMHVRVYCAPTDRIIGCEDRGSFRWLKRDAKYVWRHTGEMFVRPIERLFHRQPVQALLALSALPFPGFVAR